MVGLTPDRIDRAALEATVCQPGHGCTIVFAGVTRDNFDGKPVSELWYEAYEPMAQAQMAAIAHEAEQRWPVQVSMVHRVGRVPIGEASIVIAVGAPHRAEGYEASRFAIDALKARVPIWKKEIYSDGSEWKANAPA